MLLKKESVWSLKKKNSTILVCPTYTLFMADPLNIISVYDY